MSEPISRERALLGRVMADPALTLVTDTGKHVRPIWPVQCEQIPADPDRHPGKVCTAALRVVDTADRGAGPILVSLCDLTDDDGEG